MSVGSIPRSAVAAVTLALVLAACGGATQTDGTPAGEPSDGQTAADVLQEIAEMNMTEEERVAYLYEKAIEEGGAILIYGTQNELLAEVIEAFLEEYPELSAGYISLGSVDLFERIRAEAAAGRHLVDVINGDSILTAALYNDGLLAEHHGVPVPDAIPERYISEWAVPVALLPNVIAWNTNAMSEDEAADEWDDYLEPEHSGCVLDVGGDTFAATMIVDRGFDGAAEWYEGIIANGAQVSESNTAMTTAMAAGEYDCMIYSYVNRPEDFIQNRGAPLAWRPADPTPTNVSGPAIYQHSARPHAAALLMHFLLDVPGGEIFGGDGRVPVNPEAQLPAPFERLEAFQEGGEYEPLLMPLIGTTALEVAEQAQELLDTYLVPEFTGN